MQPDTIPARFLVHANARGDAPCWMGHDGQAWKPTSWSQAGQRVRQMARALIAAGVQPGDRVCVLGFNREAWVVADMAAMAVGGVPAGIYETCSGEEIAWIVKHAGARLLFVENEELLGRVSAARPDMPDLERIVLFPGVTGDPAAGVDTWEEFQAAAGSVTEEELDRRLAALRADAPATFIYTSGTTGPPKAVMLSHENLAWTAAQAVEMTRLGPADSTVSYLPLCHIAEQIFTIHGPATAGSAVWFARSRESLLQDLKDAQPTVFLGVPRVWEKMHEALSAKLAQATGFKASLVRWGMDVARRVHAARNAGKAVELWLDLQHRLATRLLFSKVKPAIGLGRARFCVSGAAPIAPEVLEFFTGLDLTVHEVYGQSEGSGPSSFNQPGQTRFGTVGRAFPGVELAIAPDGEVLVKGPNVFLGYFNDEAATAETLQEGWLHSGDLGSLDEEGYLRITGRKKEILITAGGKNISPANIEGMLKALPLVSQAVLIGDRRRFVSALLTLDPEAVKRALGGRLPEEPMADAALMEEIQRGIDVVNARLARVEQVRKFTILAGELTVEGGELTPTMKVKRRVVEQRYAEQIEAMYA